jgi:hypothetical protein
VSIGHEGVAGKHKSQLRGRNKLERSIMLRKNISKIVVRYLNDFLVGSNEWITGVQFFDD